MTCREFDELMHSLVRLELLDVVVREEALEHAARCEACKGRMEEARGLAEATDAAASRGRDLQAAPRVEAVLLEAFRSRRRRQVWWRGLEWAAAGAAAVALTALFWLTPYRPQPPTAPAPRRGLTSQPRGPVDASQPSLAAPGDESTSAEADVVQVAAEGASQAGDFVVLPLAGGIEPEDGGMIVRVQLTRASLAELGYPATEASGDELVRADVLVGEDGWPRAVRLVQ